MAVTSSSQAGGPDAGVPCALPHRDCGGTCVDTSVDRNHCGNCGFGCSAALACVDGQCMAHACGERGVLSLVPTGDGTMDLWAREPDTGTCFEKVDDNAFADGDFSYIWDDTANGTTSFARFTHAPVTLLPRYVVHQFLVGADARRVNAEGTATPAVHIPGLGDYQGDTCSLGPAYQWCTAVFFANPSNGQPWTPSALSNMQLAVRSGRFVQNNPVRVTRVWGEVCVDQP